MPEHTAQAAWTLRAYRAADAEALCRLDELCFSSQFQIPRAAMRRDLASLRSLTTVAVDEAGEPVGFAVAQLTRRPGEAPLAYALTLDVAPAWRERGLGAALMTAMMKAVRDAGAAGLWLHVHTGNTDAIRLYERLGMARERLDAGFYGRDPARAPVDAWVYCKWF